MTDFHRAIVETGRGTVPISYLRSPAALTFCLLIASIGLGIFSFIIFNQASAVAGPFAPAAGNSYLLALFVPLASIAILRSKILEFNGKKFGFEFIYDTYKSWSVRHYKELSAEIKVNFLGKLAKRVDENGMEFDEILRRIDGLITEATNHLPEEYLEHYQGEIAQIRANVTAVPRLHSIEHALGLLVDHTSIRTAKKWAEHTFDQD